MAPLVSELQCQCLVEMVRWHHECQCLVDLVSWHHGCQDYSQCQCLVDLVRWHHACRGVGEGEGGIIDIIINLKALPASVLLQRCSW